MKIGLSADSAIDTNQELLDKYQIHVIPYTIIMGENAVKDVNLDANDLYKFVKETNGIPKTASINTAEFYLYFEELLKTYDVVLHFNLTDTFSSTYDNACQAAQQFNGKVRVINSKSFSVGILLECIYARKLIDKNKFSVDEIVEKIEKRRPYVVATTLLQTTEYIYKGGRCNALAHFGAKLLGLRPMVIYNQKDLVVHHIFRGKYQTVVKNYVKLALKDFPNPDKSLAVISGTIVDDDIKQILHDTIIEVGGFKNTIHTKCNATISVYGGPNALGFGYYADNGEFDED